MGGHPKTSQWYSPTQEMRKRKGVRYTISDEARAALDSMAEQQKEAGERPNLSALVDEAIMLLSAVKAGRKKIVERRS